MDNYLHNLFEDNEPIPEILHSDFRKDPFETCLKCERTLDQIEGIYEIQKIYRQGRPIWEHAICSTCGEDLIEDYSDESLARIQEFMSQLDLHEEGMSECHLCSSSVETGNEHMISTLCRNDSMIISPMILCMDCLDHMNSLLSDETRDSWDEFMKDHVPGLPAQEEPTPSDMPMPGFG